MARLGLGDCAKRCRKYTKRHRKTCQVERGYSDGSEVEDILYHMVGVSIV